LQAQLYALRLGGDDVFPEDVERHDEDLRGALERCLDGPLADHSWRQATLGPTEGGLGFRKAERTALSACVASLAAALPMAGEMDASYAQAGVLPAGLLHGTVLRRFEAALDALCCQAGPDAEGEVRRIAAEGFAFLKERWACVCGGHPLPRAGDSDRGSGEGLFLEDAGLADVEHPASSAPSLQRRLLGVLDRHEGARECQRALDEDRLADWQRLTDLRHPNTDHTWLWSLNPAHGPCLDSEEVAAAVRLRLGADQVEQPVVCARCSRVPLLGACTHALCCAGGGETEGHNRVRDSVHALAVLADPSACLEPQGLVASRPWSRPADLLSYAAGPTGGCAAVDVGVACPHECGAGEDACAALVARKRRELGPAVSAELQAAGIEPLPAAWSCYGRAHPDADALLVRLARRAARRRGLPTAAGLLRRTRARIGVELWRRSVAILRACLPAATPELPPGAGMELAA